MSLFLKDPDHYYRDLDPIKNHKLNLAIYYSITKNIPFELAFSRVEVAAGENGPAAPKIPAVKHLMRPQAHADRKKAVTPLDEMLRDIEAKDRILSPSMQVYENPKVERCYQGDFIDTGLARRKIVKNEKFAAKMAGDKLLTAFKDKEQVNIKILNNSFSGANCSPHNPNYVKSAHTSLTSITRTLTSTSNSSTERFICGNRHYYNADITLENLVTTVRLIDMDKVAYCLEQYSLTPATTESTIDLVKRNTVRYFTNPKEWRKIELFIRKLNPLQLTAISGVADLRFWMDSNPEFTKTLLTRLSNLDKAPLPAMDIEEATKWIKGADDYLESLIASLSAVELAGRDLADCKKESPEVYIRIGGRAKLLTELITKEYWDFFECFFMSDVVPQSIHEFPTSIRECVIASDTDSTLYTTQTVIEWYFGKLEFSYEADCIRELITYLNSQVVSHSLAHISKQVGVPREHMFTLKMKPEFAMPVMAVTNRAKHYIATISACEGNVYKEIELETKGVGLKSSKVPRYIIEIFNAYVKKLTEVFTEGRKITPQQALSVPAYLEHVILDELRTGNSNMLYNLRIKDAAAYKNPKVSNFVYYELWQDCFAYKYGDMEEPTVDCKKIPVDLPNKTAVEEWLSGIDQETAKRIRTWMEETGRTNFKMFLVSQEFLSRARMPDEIWSAINTNKLLTDLTESFYYILECLGFYYKNKQMSRFAYHEMTMEEAEENLLLDRDLFYK